MGRRTTLGAIGYVALVAAGYSWPRRFSQWLSPRVRPLEPTSITRASHWGSLRGLALHLRGKSDEAPQERYRDTGVGQRWR